MARELILEQIAPEAVGEIGRLDGGEVLVGRDPGEGLVLDFGSVSRTHGVFYKIRNHWFYKDMASTNGSWVNGVQIQADQFRLIRPGDLLQLADVAIRLKVPAGDETVSMSLSPAFNASTLLVFQNDQFFDEFPLPEYGRALVVGGPQADLKLAAEAAGQPGVNANLPSLVIERRGETVVAYTVDSQSKCQVNSKDFTGNIKLSDADQIKVENYLILFNDPKSIGPVTQAKPAAALSRPSDLFTQAAPEAVRPRAGTGAWSLGGQEESSQKSDQFTRLAFGQNKPEDEVEGTRALDPAEIEARLAGFEMHPSNRHRMGEAQPKTFLSSFEDRLIVIVGIVILALVICLFLIWIFA